MASEFVLPLEIQVPAFRPSTRSAVFDKFFRLPRKAQTGAGLGLTIAKIIERMRAPSDFARVTAGVANSLSRFRPRQLQDERSSLLIPAGPKPRKARSGQMGKLRRLLRTPGPFCVLSKRLHNSYSSPLGLKPN